jgi:hypothetical protein
VDEDLILGRIARGVELHHGLGRRDEARGHFAAVWTEIGGVDGDPLHVCVLAHAMADVQDDVVRELAWDQRALDAAGQLTEERVAAAGVPMSVAALYPSLHLNLADCYRRLGDLDLAREHLRLARDGMGALGENDYGALIRGGLNRLVEQLEAGGHAAGS